MLPARPDGNAPGTRPRHTPCAGLREPHESVKGIQTVSDNDARVIFSLDWKNPGQGFLISMCDLYGYLQRIA